MILKGVCINYGNNISPEQKEILKQHLNDGEWSFNKGSIEASFKSNNGAILNIYTKTYSFQGTNQDELKVRIDELLSGKVEYEQTKNSKEIFIVYGHDKTSKEQLQLILKTLDLNHCMVTNDTSLTIIEALEQKISEVMCGIVLLTPDDLAISKQLFEKHKDEGSINDRLMFRARQNVILEMGMLLSKLGRENVIILLKGQVEYPSDMSGIFYLAYQEHISEIVNKLVSRLTSLGFQIDSNKLIEAINIG